ncbi:hypothetical protein GCM10020001_050830 [Nonomuraea salmonea]
MRCLAASMISGEPWGVAAEGELQHRVTGLDRDEHGEVERRAVGQPELLEEQPAQPPGDHRVVVGVGVEQVEIDGVAEVEALEAGHGPVHVDVDVDDRVDGLPPTAVVLFEEPAIDSADELLDVAPGELLGDGALVGEELVDRSDRHPGAFGDAGGRQGFVAELVEQFGTRVEHPLDTSGAAALRGLPPESFRLDAHVVHLLRRRHGFIFSR